MLDLVVKVKKVQLRTSIDGLIFTMGGSTWQPVLDKKIQHELKAKFYKHFTVSKKGSGGMKMRSRI
jgi:hypothetical protein